MVFYAKMEDWFYVLVGLAWVFFSFYQKGKKGAKNQSASKNETPLLGTVNNQPLTQYDGVGDPYLAENRQAEHLYGSHPSVKRGGATTETVRDMKMKSENNLAFEATKKEEKASLTNTINTHYDNATHGSGVKRKKIDLRQAMIYQVIFTRPQY